TLHFMGLLKEFKEFAVKGNVIDLAVGVIIGGAFGKIVSSFVNDVVMPPIGLLIGGVDFKDLNVVLKDATTNELGEEVAAVTLNYGMFIQNVVDFAIIAFVIFLAIKGINQMNKKKEEAPAPPAPPEPTHSEKLLEEIRDLLKKQQ
ncbi:MAG TPA: large-conductance mechanosensitive channel protein MscL, partial [Algoriphagus sp.]|nr:large-conductance mechanosensitive channel protein MscL [Algoriphagus sp.]